MRTAGTTTPYLVAFSGTDATSGIASCSSASYSGPDNASASVGGSCTDKAGNVGASSLPLKYDATPPAAAAATSRAADANGWYNHALTVSFAGSDVTSGIASCTSASYSGPGQRKRRRRRLVHGQGGQCRRGEPAAEVRLDAAGGGGCRTSRAADANGWYNHALTVSFAGSDVDVRDRKLLVGELFRVRTTRARPWPVRARTRPATSARRASPSSTTPLRRPSRAWRRRRATAASS